MKISRIQSQNQPKSINHFLRQNQKIVVMQMLYKNLWLMMKNYRKIFMIKLIKNRQNCINKLQA